MIPLFGMHDFGTALIKREIINRSIISKHHKKRVPGKKSDLNRVFQKKVLIYGKNMFVHDFNTI